MAVRRYVFMAAQTWLKVLGVKRVEFDDQNQIGCEKLILCTVGFACYPKTLNFYPSLLSLLLYLAIIIILRWNSYRAPQKAYPNHPGDYLFGMVFSVRD